MPTQVNGVAKGSGFAGNTPVWPENALHLHEQRYSLISDRIAPAFPRKAKVLMEYKPGEYLRQATIAGKPPHGPLLPDSTVQSASLTTRARLHARRIKRSFPDADAATPFSTEVLSRVSDIAMSNGKSDHSPPFCYRGRPPNHSCTASAKQWHTPRYS